MQEIDRQTIGHSYPLVFQNKIVESQCFVSLELSPKIVNTPDYEAVAGEILEGQV
jgi:hypothetical protein